MDAVTFKIKKTEAVLKLLKTARQFQSLSELEVKKGNIMIALNYAVKMNTCVAQAKAVRAATQYNPSENYTIVEANVKCRTKKAKIKES